MDKPPNDLKSKPESRFLRIVIIPVGITLISLAFVAAQQYILAAVIFSFGLYYALTITVPCSLQRITQNEVKAGKFASGAKLARFGVEWCRIFNVGQIGLLPRSISYDVLLKKHLSVSLMSLGRFEDAIKVDREILEELEKQGDIDGAANIRGKLSFLYQAKGDFKEADRLTSSNVTILESAARNAERNGDRTARAYITRLASAFFEQASILETKRNYAAAEPIRRRALEEIRKVFEENAPEVMPHLSMFGRLLIHLGRYDEAETALTTVLEVRKKEFPDKHILVGTAKQGVGLLYLKKGQLELAEPLLREALDHMIKYIGPEHPGIPDYKRDLAVLLIKKGLYSEAEPLLVSAIKQKETQSNDTHPDLIEMLTSLAEVKRAYGDTTSADSLLSRANSIIEKISV